LENCVILAGPKLDVARVMNVLDLHILSSLGEAFGNVTIEAMACGVPAVVTSVGAGQQIVGDTGWVVAPANALELADAITEALQEKNIPEIWIKRQEACRARIIEQFGLDKMTDGYQNVWNNCRLNNKK